MSERRRLLTTKELSDRIGISTRVIQRYRAEGLLVPELETPRGHARWDEDDVRRQLRELAAQRRREQQEG